MAAFRKRGKGAFGESRSSRTERQGLDKLKLAQKESGDSPRKLEIVQKYLALHYLSTKAVERRRSRIHRIRRANLTFKRPVRETR